MQLAYKDFFTLWKDADPDIPILKQAKAEIFQLALVDCSIQKIHSCRLWNE